METISKQKRINGKKMERRLLIWNHSTMCFLSYAYLEVAYLPSSQDTGEAIEQDFITDTIQH
jgi:hypothetical protein